MEAVYTWSRENLAKLSALCRAENGFLMVDNAPEENPAAEGFANDAALAGSGCRLPEARLIQLAANGRAYSMFSEQTVGRTQTLDLTGALSERSSVWLHPDGTLRVSFLLMASLEMPHALLLRLRVESLGFDGTLQIASALSAGGALRRQEATVELDEAALTAWDDERGGWVACRAMQGCSLPGEWSRTDSGLWGRYSGRIHPGETVRLNKIAVFAEGSSPEDASARAGRMMREARALGGDELIRRQRRRVAAWKAACGRDGHDLPQEQALALYHRMMACGADVNIGA